MVRYGLGLSGGLGMALAAAAVMAGGTLERADRVVDPPDPVEPEATPPVDVATEEEVPRIMTPSNPLEHVCLAGAKVPGVANAVAARVHAQGGSPRAQIDAARAACNKGLTYAPHQGLKERMRRAKRAAAAGG